MGSPFQKGKTVAAQRFLGSHISTKCQYRKKQRSLWHVVIYDTRINKFFRNKRLYVKGFDSLFFILSLWLVVQDLKRALKYRKWLGRHLDRRKIERPLLLDYRIEA